MKNSSEQLPPDEASTRDFPVLSGKTDPAAPAEIEGRFTPANPAIPKAAQENLQQTAKRGTLETSERGGLTSLSITLPRGLVHAHDRLGFQITNSKSVIAFSF